MARAVRTALRTGLLVLSAPLAALLSACGGDAADPDPVAPVATGPTYHEHIKPILDARCGSCHQDGELAPFSVARYDDLLPWGGAIRRAVLDRTMPPWLADGDCNQYLGDRSLSDAQIQAISAWVDAGMPAGDPARQGAPIDIGPQPSLSRTDLTLPLPVEYTPQVGPDEYRCFPIPWPADEVTYVTGLSARPGEPRVVHHVIAYVADPAQVAQVDALDAADPGPGYPCYGGPSFDSPRWLGAWVPGSLGADSPPGTGLRVEPGSRVVVQMHYNLLAAGPLPDRTELDIKLDPAVERDARVQPFTNPAWVDSDQMMIPAYQDDVPHEFSADISFLAGGAYQIHDIALHMHALGRVAQLSIERADGTSTCLLDIPRWDFHWQGSYRLAQPVPVSPGDKLKIACRFDNSPENQPLVDGQQKLPEDVTWGEGTGDEMCLGTVYMNPL